MSSIGIDIRNIGKKRTGDEVVVFNLVKNLAVIDTINDYKLFTDIADQEILAKIREDLEIKNKSNFEVISLPTINKFTWNFWTLPRYLQKNEVDIYLTQYITPFFVPEEIKIATIIHDVSFRVYKQFIRKSDLFFLNLLIPRSLKRADKIIAVSRFTHDEILKYYKVSDDKVDWVHNAVAGDFLNADLSEEKLESVRKKYNLPEKYILYLGTLQPRKNIPTLINAYKHFLKLSFRNGAQTSQNIQLVIAGGKSHNFDPKIDEAVEESKLKDKIIFPGFINEEDKAAVMKMADVFCLPSYYEGFGIPILEAMSVGTPVIVSDIPPHKEIAQYAALYFNPESPEELAKIIDSLVNDENLRQDMAKKGLEQVKKFSWSRTARRMLEIFEGMK